MTTKTLITRGGVLLALVVVLPLLSSCALNALIVRWPDGTNVLNNGSFEDGAFVADQFGVMKVLPNDSTTIKNWTVVKRADPQDVAWYQNGNSFSIATTDGVRFLDLTGSAKVPHNGPFGGVIQKFSTIVGVEYHVSFYIGVWPTYDPGSISVTAKWGTAANDENPVLVVCGPFKLESGITWKSCGVNLSDADFNNYTFKATVEETFLTLVGDGKDINPGAFLQYMGLDNVRVECMAPLGIHRFCNGGSF